MNENRSPIAEQPFKVGDRVFLRGARFGLPGTILRLERGRAVVFLGRPRAYLAA